MKLHTELGARGYDIIIERGSLGSAHKYFNLDRKVLIVTDSGVPREYSEKVASQCGQSYILTLDAGEASKNFDNYRRILSVMAENRFTRTDCVVAVGGGVVGDISGFAAATYMRGIDFYNVPTTVLSAVDSSVGGKCAIDLNGIKNIVGAFHQPRAVLIDPETLRTLDSRQVSNGLAEAIKMSLTSSAELFELFENGDALANMDKIIYESVKIKKSVVEQDERESGLRRILNFGHTLGHGVESASELSALLHGECVAIGMIPMCSENVRNRLVPVLEKIGLPTKFDGDIDEALKLSLHDKKSDGDSVSVVFVKEVGSFEIIKMTHAEFFEHIKRNVEVLK